MLTWELALEQLLTGGLTPTQIENRGAFWKDDEVGLHNPDQNMLLRLRSYASEGYGFLQESALVTGEAGSITRGNDRSLDRTSITSFADTILHSAETVHLKVPNNNLLWNYTPFNPQLNPTFAMPPGLETAEDAFNFAKASVPGATSIQDIENQITSIQNLVNTFAPLTIPNGAVNFTDPFQTYCTLTPQKIPMMNFGAIMFLQMLMLGIPGLLMAGLFPVTLGPVGLALLPLIKMQFQTSYNASQQGTVIGQSLQAILVSSIPGMGMAFGGVGAATGDSGGG